MDYGNPSRCHSSSKSKSVSVLPVHHPELDSLHRRSGIRHFSSIRTAPGEKKARACGKFRKKGRAVMGPMEWRNLLNKAVGGGKRSSKEYTNRAEYPRITMIPQTMEEVTRATLREQQAINELQNIRHTRDPLKMMRRVPVPGQGCFLVPQDQQDIMQPQLDYPYPQHIPPAASQHYSYPSPSSISGPSPIFVPSPNRSTVPAMIPLDRLIFIIYGIGIAIAFFFAWKFRKEVIRIGGIIVILFLIWKFGQWNTRVSLENRERELLQQGRLIPLPEYSQDTQQQQQQRPLRLEYHQSGMVPGSWL